MKKTIISTSTIRNTKSVSKPRKTTEHSPAFIEKQNRKLREKLIIELKTDDPRNFILSGVKIIPMARLKDEEFKLIPTTTKYYVSNKGRAMKLVYDKFTDVYLEHELNIIYTLNKTGKKYADINIILEDGSHIRCRLSRAIAKAFLDPNFPLLFDPNNKIVVDHINNNSENNELSNLRIVTQSENIRSAIFQQGRIVGKKCRECHAYNVHTGELRKYKSTGELCRDIWNSSNKGYFHAYRTSKSTSSTGWRVGYTKEEVMNGDA